MEKTKNVIICGDFNALEDPKNDSNKDQTKLRPFDYLYVDYLHGLSQTPQTRDVHWISKDHRKGIPAFTFIKKYNNKSKPTSKSRLDKILTTENLLSKVVSSETCEIGEIRSHPSQDVT